LWTSEQTFWQFLANNIVHFGTQVPANIIILFESKSFRGGKE
jgi:hypothetical protein